METKVLDLSTLVGDMHEMLSRLLGENIDLRTVNRAPAGRIRADRGQVEQILVNLAVNARDAMPGGGRLTIETRDVTLDDAYCRQHGEAQPGEYVMMAVSDTGVGMDEATRTRLFEPFFTTKQPGEGTGLGLSTVHGIVAQHGGTIGVYSEPGRGTVMKVYFPRIEEAARPKTEPGASAALPRGSERILVVEDDAMVRAVAVAILTRQGYEVIAAESGPAALKQCERGGARIDLLMTDVVMPGMNGRELADTLQARRPGLRLLFTSGYTENVIGQHGVLDEGVAFLGKPYTPRSLAAKVREVLDA